MYLANNTHPTTNSQDEFTPTFLYIKQHNITGLKYFGKTIRDNPEKYKGSGAYWADHLKKHGNDVSTIWYKQFNNKTELVEFATNFSVKNNIVEAKNNDGKKIWANLAIENGLDGAEPGRKRGTYEHTTEAKQKMRRNHKDFSKQNNPMFGQKQKQLTCNHCGTIAGANTYSRWHGNNCKKTKAAYILL